MVVHRTKGAQNRASLEERARAIGDASRASMVEPDEYPLVTASGKELSEADVQALADEAEAGYDVEKIRKLPSRRLGPMRKHEFVMRDNPDGGHRDSKCEACGLGNTNPVHDNAKGVRL